MQPKNGVEELMDRMKRRELRVGIIGLGYVGLPLAMAFAEEGVEVIGVDVSEGKIATLQGGGSDVEDISPAQVERHVRAGRFRASTSFAELAGADTISICVPTPLGKSRDPDISYIVAATEALLPHLRAGQLVVLESTTYPGTTREVVEARIARAGFGVGEDVALAFSPERIDPGNEEYGVRNTPKVVGGCTPLCTRAAAGLYGIVCDHVVPVGSVEIAEVVKLLENTFRAVNIALVNEIAVVCDKLGINVWEVVAAAATKPFGFMPFYPGPGLGGHCIPIDPLYLSWKLRSLNYNVRFIELADEINRSMPELVVSRVIHALNGVCKAVRGARILLVGMAYKGGVGDLRESPALEVAAALAGLGAELIYFDPFVERVVLDHGGLEIPRVAGFSGGYDLALILTKHPDVDYAELVNAVPLVVDTRNATRGIEGSAQVQLL